MAKKKQLTINLKLVIGTLVIACIFFILLFLRFHLNTSISTSSPSAVAPKYQTVRSDKLKITFTAPAGYVIESKLNGLVLKNKTGKIDFDKQGTNFNNVEDYLKDFDSKRSLEVTEEKTLKIGTYEAVLRTENFKGGSVSKLKNYYIYNDYWIYSFATENPALFGDLDQIADSFQYSP